MPTAPKASALALLVTLMFVVGTAVGAFVLIVAAPLMGITRSDSITPSLIAAACFSIVTDAILIAYLRRRQGGASLEPLQSIVVDAPLAGAFERASAALRAVGATIIEADCADGLIRARTGVSSRSWGEVVTIKLHEGSPHETGLVIHSRPRLVITLFDAGKNEDNVRAVMRALAEQRRA